MSRKKSFLFILLIIICGFAAAVYKYHFWHPHLTPTFENSKADNSYQTFAEYNIDFESGYNLNNNSSISTERFSSGKKSSKLDASKEFGSGFEMNSDGIDSCEKINLIHVDFLVSSADAGEGSVVVEINSQNGKNNFWQEMKLDCNDTAWSKRSYDFIINKGIAKNSIIKIYPWNKSRKLFFVDDLHISLIKNKNSAGIGSKDNSHVFFDFESENENNSSVVTGTAFSGTHASRLKGANSYSQQVCRKVKDVVSDSLTGISCSVHVYTKDEKIQSSIVLEITNDKGKQILWSEKKFTASENNIGKWFKVNADFHFPPEVLKAITPTDNVCIYVWNRDDNKVYVDDFDIVYQVDHSREGSPGNIFIDPKKNYSWTQPRFTPPFRYIFLQNDGVNILQESTNKNTINPRSVLLAGNFVNDEKEELLAIENKSLILYSFGSHDSVLNKLRSYHLDETSNDKNILAAAKITQNAFDEFIILDRENKVLNVYSINQSLQKVASYVLTEFTSAEHLHALILHKEKHSDIFILDDNNGKYIILSADGSKLSRVKTGNLPQDCFGSDCSIISGNFTGDDVDILITFTKNAKRIAKLISHPYSIPHVGAVADSLSELIHNNSSVLILQNYRTRHDEILLYNSDKRFDMNVIAEDDKGFYISGKIDFRGYPGNQNPKFYEVQQFITGRFLSSSSSLMCILYNCEDENYSGGNCVNYAHKTDFPNTLQFYSAGNE